MSALAAFFLDTRLGQSILLALALTAAIAFTWHHVDASAYKRGAADVQARWDQSKLGAAQSAAQFVSGQAKAGSDLAADTAAKSQAAQAPIVKTVTETKEVIRHVYVDRPVVVPPTAAACLRDLDDRVQQRIELGLDQARSPAR